MQRPKDLELSANNSVIKSRFRSLTAMALPNTHRPFSPELFLVGLQEAFAQKKDLAE